VIYRLGGKVKAALIFSSGKIVFTGAKTKEDIIEAYEYLRDKLKYFRSIKN
jgi:TATA-box binding protein (TBP) (component of TFIID and TFIIIB)